MGRREGGLALVRGWALTNFLGASSRWMLIRSWMTLDAYWNEYGIRSGRLFEARSRFQPHVFSKFIFHQ